jgi:predicted TIM-barrel fold metal-dependent hydrolase
MQIVDIHPHVIAADHARYPLAPVGDRLSEWAARRPVTCEQLLAFARPPLDDGPPYAAARPLFALAAYPHVYVKLSTVTHEDAARGRSTPRAFLEQLAGEFGAGRIAWGSNFPASEGPLAALVALAREWVAFLPAEDQQRILGGTALALYPRLGGALSSDGGVASEA